MNLLSLLKAYSVLFSVVGILRNVSIGSSPKLTLSNFNLGRLLNLSKLDYVACIQAWLWISVYVFKWWFWKDDEMVICNVCFWKYISVCLVEVCMFWIMKEDSFWDTLILNACMLCTKVCLMALWHVKMEAHEWLKWLIWWIISKDMLFGKMLNG